MIIHDTDKFVSHADGNNYDSPIREIYNESDEGERDECIKRQKRKRKSCAAFADSCNLQSQRVLRRVISNKLLFIRDLHNFHDAEAFLHRQT